MLHFAAGTVGTYTGPVTFRANSTPGQFWGEFVDGTHPPVTNSPTTTNCAGAPADISGFSGTLTGTNGSQTLNCTFVSGTYLRNGNRDPNHTPTNPDDDEIGLDITYQGSTQIPLLLGNCGGETSITVKTSIVLAPTPGGTACNSPIAPQTCLLGPDRSNQV